MTVGQTVLAVKIHWRMKLEAVYSVLLRMNARLHFPKSLDVFFIYFYF